MCKKRKKGCLPCKCYPKRATDYFDLFAEPVYNFTFEDSYVVSTCIGSLATIGLILFLVIILLNKVNLYVDDDPSTYFVTEGIDRDYYSEDTEFDKHQIAVGLSYRAEHQIEMTEDFTEKIAQIADIQMFTRTKILGATTPSDPLKLDPCTTLDVNLFNESRKGLIAEKEYI